jgi:hypothetical protein
MSEFYNFFHLFVLRVFFLMEYIVNELPTSPTAAKSPKDPKDNGTLAVGSVLFKSFVAKCTLVSFYSCLLTSKVDSCI